MRQSLLVKILFCLILHGENNGACSIQQKNVTVQNNTLVSEMAL